MVTVEVSNWTELVTALSTDTSEEKTIKLIADIDCNDTIPAGVASSITVYNSKKYPLVIDGSYTQGGKTKNHIIKNLRTNITSPVYIFSLTYNSGSSGTTDNVLDITFQNIDFLNLILDRPLIGNLDGGRSYNEKVRFTSCRFVGKRKQFLVIGSSWRSSDNNGLIFTSCYFNVPYMPDDTSRTYVPLVGDWVSSSDGACFANYCRFVESYNGWSTGQFSPGIVTDPQASTYNFKLNGCYVEGTVVFYNSLGITKYYSYDSSMQNVIDADLRDNSNTSAGATLRVTVPKGVYKNLIRKYGDDTVVYYDDKYYSSSISATPEQMQDPAWLASQGFDVVVPV